MTRVSELSASCRNLAGHGRLKALPQPVLQRIEANEPRISRKQLMLVAAVLGSLPGELHRVDENQSCGHAPVCLVERDWVGREAGHFGKQCAVERDGCRRIEFCRCGTEGY